MHDNGEAYSADQSDGVCANAAFIVLMTAPSPLPQGAGEVSP